MDWSAVATAVNEVVTDLGQTMTHRRVTVGAPNSETGVATQTTVDTTVNGVVTPVTNRPGTTPTERLDAMVVIAGSDLASEPTAGDQLIISSVTWMVVTVETVQPATTRLAYQCGVRRGGN